MITDDRFTDEDIQKRCEMFYSDSRKFADGQIQTQNKDLFLSADFGLKEFKVKSKKDHIDQGAGGNAVVETTV
jgi:hypothetical protein